MQIPAFKRIIVEDYDPKYKDLISKLAYSINTFADTTNTALTGNLSINDNTNEVQTQITVTVDSKGTPTSGGTVNTGLSGQCGGSQVIYAVNNTNSTSYPTNTPFISFTNATNNIIIKNITGLKANNSYTLTVIFYPTS